MDCKFKKEIHQILLKVSYIFMGHFDFQLSFIKRITTKYIQT